MKKDIREIYIFIKGILENENLTLANIYAPNQSQMYFLDATLMELETYREGEVVIGGDFNYIVDNVWDRSQKKTKQGNTED